MSRDSQTNNQNWGINAPSISDDTQWESAMTASKNSWGAGNTSSHADNWSSMNKQMEETSLNDDHTSSYRERPSYSHDSGEPTVAIEEAWPTFAEADESRDLDEIKTALAQLCNAYRGKSWQDLENKFRAEKCNTYLVAVDDQVSFGYTLVNLRGEPNQRYRIISSLIKPGTAKRGRMALGVASDYDENYDRLENSGVVRPSRIPRCFNCRQDGHVASACPEEKREIERSENFGRCYNCGAEEHRTRDCPEPRKAMICRNCGKEGHQSRSCPEPPAPPVCNRCYQEGHMSRDCVQPRTDVTCRRCNQVGHMVRDCTEPKPDTTCNRCKKVGHFSRECPMPTTCNRCGAEDHRSVDCPHPRTDIRCHRCDEIGHIARDCPLDREQQRSCFNCGSTEHIIRDCPTLRSDNRFDNRSDIPPRRNRIGFDYGF